MATDLPGILIVDDNEDNRYTLQLLLEFRWSRADVARLLRWLGGELCLGQRWPAKYAPLKQQNRFICANPAGIQAPGECIVLGRECTSLLELESVAKDIRADLDRVIDDARKKLGNST